MLERIILSCNETKNQWGSLIIRALWYFLERNETLPDTAGGEFHGPGVRVEVPDCTYELQAPPAEPAYGSNVLVFAGQLVSIDLKHRIQRFQIAGQLAVFEWSDRV